MKHLTNYKIALSRSYSILTTEKEIANTINSYFINITKHLNLKPRTTSNTMYIEQLTSFNNHVSIKKLREVFPEISLNNFEFTEVTEEIVKNKIPKKIINKWLYYTNNFETVC